MKAPLAELKSSSSLSMSEVARMPDITRFALSKSMQSPQGPEITNQKGCSVSSKAKSLDRKPSL